MRARQADILAEIERILAKEKEEIARPISVVMELRAAAGIAKDAILLGMGNHFELWDKATYDAQEAQAMQGEMPDVFKDFSF